MATYLYVSSEEESFAQRIAASTNCIPTSVVIAPAKSISVTFTSQLSASEKENLDIFMTDNDFSFDSET